MHLLRTTLRTLLRNRLSTAINLAGLTLGVTACLVIFLITHFELSFDTFHPDRGRIYRLVGQLSFTHKPGAEPVGFVPRAMPRAVRAEIEGLEKVAAFHNTEMPVTVPDGSPGGKRFEGRKMGLEPARIIVTEPEYFDIFPYEWLAGNPQTALSEPFRVVLTEEKARLYFGDLPADQLLGRELIYRDSLRAQVSGIVRGWSGNTDLTFTDFISQVTIGASWLKREINLEEWNDIWSASQAFVKLERGVTPAQLEAQFPAFAARHFGPERGTGEISVLPALQPLSDLHFNYDFKDNYSRKAHLPTLYGLLAVALFILLIAAINFINLATARSLQRAREVGVRKVLGGSRGALALQFMGETLVLTLAATGLGLLLTPWVIGQFRSFVPDDFRWSLLNPSTGLFLLTLILTTTLLAGFYPSRVLSAYQPAATLRGQAALSGNRRGYLRQGLIVFQFTVSLVFIVGSIVVGRQLDFIRQKDLGFASNAVVVLDIAPDDKNRVLAGQIRQMAGVERVAMQWFAPLSEGYMLTRMKYKGGTTPFETDVSAKIGDENFIPLYGFRLLAGRNFRPADSLRELVINEKYARMLGFRQPADAVGQLLEFQGREYPVCGVVADFHEETLHRPIGPTFMANLPDLTKGVAVKLAGNDVQGTMAGIEAAYRSIFPDRPFAWTFLDDSIAKLYGKEQKTAQLVRTATLVAILISCLGLFGLITFMAEQRRKEIGVRKVLGASAASIAALLSRDYLKLVLLAFGIASPLAWWAMNRWLQDFAYRIDLQGWMFIVAGAVAVAVAFLTVGAESWRAGRENPVKALRRE